MREPVKAEKNQSQSQSWGEEKAQWIRRNRLPEQLLEVNSGSWDAFSLGPIANLTQLSFRVSWTWYLLLSGWSTLQAVHLFLCTSLLQFTFQFLTL